MKEKIAKKVHDIRGSLSVVMGFLRLMDKGGLNPDGQKLYEACKVSLDKIVVNLNEIQEIAANDLR